MNLLGEKHAVVVGGGPAGLMAAEQLAASGIKVDLYDAMPSVARKFLLAGIGGMNITHSEALEQFATRYFDSSNWMRPMLKRFGPAELIDWIHGLGIETIVGSSGRVFPVEMKAAPLLRKWKHRLSEMGVVFHPRHRWIGWADSNRISFESESGVVEATYDVLVLAMGGGSWKKLGSNGAWMPVLAEQGIDLNPLVASNCGYEVSWSDYLIERADRQAIKKVGLAVEGQPGIKISEILITAYGVEGTGIYAIGNAIRRSFAECGSAVLNIDLFPERSVEELNALLKKGPARQSLSSRLRKNLKMTAAQVALANEPGLLSGLNEGDIAQRLKAVSVSLIKPRPIDEAISTAGGVSLDAVDSQLMLTSMPGVFVAGEMLDWDAPTGGYLLTGCFTTGYHAGRGAVSWLK